LGILSAILRFALLHDRHKYPVRVRLYRAGLRLSTVDDSLTSERASLPARPRLQESLVCSERREEMAGGFFTRIPQGIPPYILYAKELDFDFLRFSSTRPSGHTHPPTDFAVLSAKPSLEVVKIWSPPKNKESSECGEIGSVACRNSSAHDPSIHRETGCISVC
jgi:hypothetical protein